MVHRSNIYNSKEVKGAEKIADKNDDSSFCFLGYLRIVYLSPDKLGVPNITG